MAKKKATKAIKEYENPTMATIAKKYGKIIESGTTVLDRLDKLEVIGLSPALDIALGGGIREGTVVGMTGDPKTGKTTTALYFASKAQAAGKKVFYFNTEGRLTKENFRGIKGLDIAAIEIAQATDDKPNPSAEDYLNSLELLIKTTPDLVCIVDSLSNIVPQDELDGEIRTGVRNALPRLLSMFFKRIAGDVARNKVILICITHNIANTGGSPYAAKKHSDCGNMLQYTVGTNMVITHRGRWEVPKESGNHVGQVAHWQIKTSAAGAKPNAKCDSWIKYGIGIDESQEIAQIAVDFTFAKRKGAWYTITSCIDNPEHPTVAKWLKEREVDLEEKDALLKVFRFQGMDNFTEFLSDNPDICDYLYEQIKEVYV